MTRGTQDGQLPIDYSVTHERVRDGSQDADAFDTVVREHGLRATKGGFVVRGEGASPDVAEKLQVAESSPVIVRIAYRLIDDRPAAIDTSYYPADLAAGTELEGTEDIMRGAIQVLAEAGYPQSKLVGIPRLRGLRADEAEFLGLPAGSMWVEAEHLAYSGTRPIRLTRAVYLPERVQWSYSIAEPVA